MTIHWSINILCAWVMFCGYRIGQAASEDATWKDGAVWAVLLFVGFTLADIFISTVWPR